MLMISEGRDRPLAGKHLSLQAIPSGKSYENFDGGSGSAWRQTATRCRRAAGSPVLVRPKTRSKSLTRAPTIPRIPLATDTSGPAAAAGEGSGECAAAAEFRIEVNVLIACKSDVRDVQHHVAPAAAPAHQEVVKVHQIVTRTAFPCRRLWWRLPSRRSPGAPDVCVVRLAVFDT